jgi:hypothetical protein
MQNSIPPTDLLNENITEKRIPKKIGFSSSNEENKFKNKAMN